MLGDCVVVVDNVARRFKPLTVRELVSMQNVLAERAAADAIADAKAAGLDASAMLDRAKEARENARLVSQLIRWCFTLEGASEIVRCSAGAERFETETADMSADQFTELALQLVGFDWSDTEGKWVRRSRSATGGANG